jgi:hypothetical protein
MLALKINEKRANVRYIVDLSILLMMYSNPTLIPNITTLINVAKPRLVHEYLLLFKSSVKI